MCGIVGYIGPRDAAPLLLAGLRQLEYRGYDSAGIAVLDDQGTIHLQRSPGKLANLESLLTAHPLPGHMGIGHTRWATHGQPSESNAHPHRDCTGSIVVIHNGIVENYLALKEELIARGHRFTSQTDTEVIAHLIEDELDPRGDPSPPPAKAADHEFAGAVRRALARIRGAHAIVVMAQRAPDQLIAARLGNAGGVVIGLGEGEVFLASDLPAILNHTRRVIFLESGEVARVGLGNIQVHTLMGRAVAKTPQVVNLDPVSAAKAGYKHFMLKEIEEQPRALGDALAGRLDPEHGQVILEEVHLTEADVGHLHRVILVGCGTAWHACLVGKFLIEEYARIPVEVDYASEFRYRRPLVDEHTLLVAVTQSGETVDTLTAMEQARSQGARLLSIVNVVGSQASRLADDVIPMHVGLEIGVAASKTFTAQLACLAMLALHLGQLRGHLRDDQARAMIAELATIPELVGRALRMPTPYEDLAQRYHTCRDFLYLGRGINYPLALEGALKLKEISYIHAEGYPAGEMKHGPIALIDESMPVVAIAVRDHVYEKMVSNIEQVIARGGTVIAVATEGDQSLANKAHHVIYVPVTPPWLAPLVIAIPMQLLAYHLAVRRGCDVDQPRNLAKSVTVE